MPRLPRWHPRAPCFTMPARTMQASGPFHSEATVPPCGRQTASANVLHRLPLVATPPMALDPENDTTLYFGAQSATCCGQQVVYQTTNGGANWTPISPDLSKGL